MLQESILLFVIYINNFYGNIVIVIRKFVDDRKIGSIVDGE